MNDALVGIVGAVLTFLGVVLLWRQANKRDKVVAVSGVATDSRADFSAVVAALHADAANFRADIKRCEERYDALDLKFEALQHELIRLYRKYGENGEPK